MDHYKDIRHLYVVEGLSQRAIAKRLGISRKTVKRYCLGEVIPWEKRPRAERKKRSSPKKLRNLSTNALRRTRLLLRSSTTPPSGSIDRLEIEKDFQGAEPTVRRLVSHIEAQGSGS